MGTGILFKLKYKFIMLKSKRYGRQQSLSRFGPTRRSTVWKSAFIGS